MTDANCTFYGSRSPRTCTRPASESDGLCLQHSRNPSKNATEFWNSIQQQLDARNYNFDGYMFPSDADFSAIRFDRQANFGRADFSGPVSFAKAQFCHQAYFSGANFSDSASFRGTRFGDDTSSIANSTVEERSASKEFPGTHFSYATFSGRTDFSSAIFSEEVHFFQAAFLDEVEFGGTEFQDTAIFIRSKFSRPLQFYAKLHRGGYFVAIDFPFTVFLDLQISGFLSLSDLQHVTFRSVDLSNCRLANARNLDKAEFDVVEWARWPPSSSPIEDDGKQQWWQNFAVSNRISGYLRGRPRLAVLDEIVARYGLQGATLEEAERVYRGLRASYESRKDHPRIGDFYFGEMEMRRLASSDNWIVQTFGSLTAWYGLVSGYGERWLRALIAFCTVVCLWALLYLVSGLWVKAVGISNTGISETRLVFAGVGPSQLGVPVVGNLVESYGAALLHSFLVATLVGRDVYAQPVSAIGQLVQTAELIIGPLLLGLMGLAIRRRFQR